MDIQTYRLDFGTDKKLYSVSFKGKIPLTEVRKMLERLQNCLYENMAEHILTYLGQKHLEYSDFTVREIPLQHETVSKCAISLLQSDSCDIVNDYIGIADIYCGIMDYQHWSKNGGCEGCYCVVKKIPSGEIESCQYKIIGQTFRIAENIDEEQGYFTIRTNDGDRRFHNIDAAKGELVLPAFGCIDMLGLLLKIDGIKTAEQAVKIATKS